MAERGADTAVEVLSMRPRRVERGSGATSERRRCPAVARWVGRAMVCEDLRTAGVWSVEIVVHLLRDMPCQLHIMLPPSKSCRRRRIVAWGRGASPPVERRLKISPRWIREAWIVSSQHRVYSHQSSSDIPLGPHAARKRLLHFA